MLLALNFGTHFMSRKLAPKPDDPAQYKRFLEAAKKAEADETEDGADKAFMKVVSSRKLPAVRQEAQSGAGTARKTEKR